MSSSTENLQAALERGMTGRPAVGGFPYLAEALRAAGVTHNHWQLPAGQSLYLTTLGPVVMQGTPVASGLLDVAPFDQAALVRALRTDQAGESSFEEFLRSCWEAGVVSYSVQFDARTVTYRGAGGEEYVEAYPAAQL
jgi:uncharacterized protein YbcV (DUF1398 family)